MLLTEIEISFTVYKNSSEKKLTEISNKKSVPFSSEDEIAR